MVGKDKKKYFHDAVHGSITIPSKWCKEIIDTLEFQRLRRIEQTSMRTLFPSAHHDRFSHSLGTYHVGCMIADCIENNTDSKIKGDKDAWSKLIISYKLACLLHDCGHAPFSHTFEDRYNDSKDNKAGKVDSKLKKLFSKDIPIEGAKTHEKIGAILVFEKFGDIIENLKGEKELVARMIIGCFYKENSTDDQKIRNCFISLLNGHIIDADRLDYIMRDKWSSGYNAVSMNLSRLLRDIKLTNNNNNDIVVCFGGGAMNEVEYLIDSKNFQNKLFAHHKINYEQYLLVKAVESLNKKMQQSIFDLDSFHCSKTIEKTCKDDKTKKVHIYLPSDDDIIHLLKNDILENNNEYAEEYLSRKHKRKPLWKSPSEFNMHFKDLDKELKYQDKELHRAIKKVLSNYTDSYVTEPIEIKTSSILDSKNLYFEVDNQVKSYSDLQQKDINSSKKESLLYLYAYIPEDINRDEVIRYIIDKANNVDLNQ